VRLNTDPVARRVRVRVAANFFARLRGLIGAPPLASGEGMWIAPCCAVHTFGMTRPIDVVFVNGDGCVVAVHAQLPPRRLRACWTARATLELAAGFADQAGIRPGARLRWASGGDPNVRACVVEERAGPAPSRSRLPHRRPIAGSAAIEWLIAAPLVLLLGLGALQWALLFHGRQALDYALQQAARAGAVGGASAASIERGLAQGLLPYFGGGSAGHPVSLSLPDAIVRVRAGQPAGWLQWRQLSPTRASFDDWGEPARDAYGDPVAGAIEIPNDNLRHRPRVAGALSGQTLADANLLKLELRYGAPLSVPLVGALAVWWMEILDGCRASEARMLGAVPLPSVSASGASQPWRCVFYRAPDENGRPVARWPVRVYALVRMHTPARLWAHTPAHGSPAAPGGAPGSPAPSGSSASAGPQTSSGGADPLALPAASPILGAWALELPPAARVNPLGGDATADGSAGRARDFLQIGADRQLPNPASCGPN